MKFHFALLASLLAAPALADDCSDDLMVNSKKAGNVEFVQGDCQVIYKVTDHDYCLASTQLKMNGMVVNEEELQCVKTVSYDIDEESCKTGPKFDATAEIRREQTFAELLPETTQMKPIHRNKGQGHDDASYWDVYLSGNNILAQHVEGQGGKGHYDAWCIDADKMLRPYKTYTSSIYSSYLFPKESLKQTDNRSKKVISLEGHNNLHLINYMINNKHVDKKLGECGKVTYSDYQRAIWMMVDDDLSSAGLYHWSDKCAQAVVEDAQKNGQDWEITCEDEIGVILFTYDQQTLFVEVPFGDFPSRECTKEIVVASLEAEPLPVARMAPPNPIDTEPPVIDCPIDMTSVEATSVTGAVVTYDTPTATDNVDENVVVTCSPESGSVFPPGKTTVKCHAKDSTGNESEECGFVVSVEDTTPPAITCPMDMENVEATIGGGTMLLYEPPTATDDATNDSDIAISCSPPSGTAIPIGITSVTCTATDAADLTGDCLFKVTVVDTVPPKITCPVNMNGFEAKLGSDGTTVEYEVPPATDDADLHVDVVCSPPSGSVMQIGETTITCTATDNEGNSADCTFDINVAEEPTPPNEPEPEPTATEPEPEPTATEPEPISTRIGGGAFGDPHVTTWAGEHYSYHGACDLVLVQDHDFANGLGLDIHIRNKRDRQWSYIDAAVVRIGSDTLEVKGGKGNEFWVNGVQGDASLENGALDQQVGGYPVKFRYLSNGRRRRFFIDLGNGDEIILKTFKQFVRVALKANNAETFKSSVGLMGTYPEGKKIARDHTTLMEDYDEFGQEWQVLAGEPMLFHDMEGAQAPQKCEMPIMSDARRLAESSISLEEAETLCSHVHDEAEKDECIFDVLATEDKDVVGAY